MDAINLDDADLRDLVSRAESGESIGITRDGRSVARMVPVQPPTPPFDWDALRRLRESLPFDPVNSVEEMRRQARY